MKLPALLVVFLIVYTAVVLMRNVAVNGAFPKMILDMLT